MCGSVLQHMPIMQENHIHSCRCTESERSEGGYKLMWNMSSEEQQALKPVTRCAEKKKNHSGFNTWRATSVSCSNKNTGGTGFTVWLWIILFCEHWYYCLSARCCSTMKRAKLNVTEKVLWVWRFTISHQELRRKLEAQFCSKSKICATPIFQLKSFISDKLHWFRVCGSGSFFF